MKENRMVKCVKWLAVVMLMILLFPNVVQAAELRTGICRYDYAFQVLTLVNQQRADAGVPALTMDQGLLDVAMARAAEQTVTFGHTCPNGSSCFDVFPNKSDASYWAENAAMGQSSPEAVMNSWMNSSGHKANILNANVTAIGVGCFEMNGSFYWIQCFVATSEIAAAANPGNLKVTYSIATAAGQSTYVVSSQPYTGEEEPDLSCLETKVSGFKVTAGKKKLTLNWKKKSGVDGYQVQIATKKSFQGAKSYMLGAGKTKKVITKYNGKGMASGKKYYVRIRAYVNVEDSSGEMVRKYSKWKTLNKKTK